MADDKKIEEILKKICDIVNQSIVKKDVKNKEGDNKDEVL